VDTGAVVDSDTVWNSQLTTPLLLTGKTTTIILFWNQPAG